MYHRSLWVLMYTLIIGVVVLAGITQGHDQAFLMATAITFIGLAAIPIINAIRNRSLSILKYVSAGQSGFLALGFGLICLSTLAGFSPGRTPPENLVGFILCGAGTLLFFVLACCRFKESTPSNRNHVST